MIDCLNLFFLRVDLVRLLAVDGVRRVTSHFEKVRTTKESAANAVQGSTSIFVGFLGFLSILKLFHCNSGSARPVFLISPHLLSPEREAEYLSKLAETLVFFLWPKSYGKCAPVRHLLKVNNLTLDVIFWIIH